MITDRSEQDAFAIVKFAFEDDFEVAQRSSLNDDLVALLQLFAGFDKATLVDPRADNPKSTNSILITAFGEVGISVRERQW